MILHDGLYGLFIHTCVSKDAIVSKEKNFLLALKQRNTYQSIYTKNVLFSGFIICSFRE